MMPWFAKFYKNLSECDMSCPGDSKTKCGGFNRMNIHLISSNWDGACYEDNKDGKRLFDGMRKGTTLSTADKTPMIKFELNRYLNIRSNTNNHVFIPQSGVVPCAETKTRAIPSMVSSMGMNAGVEKSCQRPNLLRILLNVICPALVTVTLNVVVSIE